MTDVVVRFFNSQRVLDPFVERRFTPEVEEEAYYFNLEKNTGTLFIMRDDLTNPVAPGEQVAMFADGRWAEVEYK